RPLEPLSGPSLRLSAGRRGRAGGGDEDRHAEGRNLAAAVRNACFPVAPFGLGAGHDRELRPLHLFARLECAGGGPALSGDVGMAWPNPVAALAVARLNRAGACPRWPVPLRREDPRACNRSAARPL